MRAEFGFCQVLVGSLRILLLSTFVGLSFFKVTVDASNSVDCYQSVDKRKSNRLCSTIFS